MATLTLAKTIEARKLNPKTLVPLPGPAITIPYGAIIDQLQQDRDDAKFRYQMEMYSCRYRVLEEALDKGGREATHTEAGAAAAPAPNNKPKLQWEHLTSNGPAALRAKIPGGWLVAVGSGVIFYPDAEHAWDGTSS